MTELGRHQRAIARLGLRDCERRDDHRQCVELCETLIADGQWREVWEYSGRLLERARERKYIERVPAGEPHAQPGDIQGQATCVELVVKLEGPDVHAIVTWHEPPVPELAAHAANVVRLLGPGAPWGRVLMTRIDFDDPDLTVDVHELSSGQLLQRYITALQLWRRRGWFDFLVSLEHPAGWTRSQGVAYWHRGGIMIRAELEVPGFVPTRPRPDAIGFDGSVLHCGLRCPPLPEVPLPELPLRVFVWVEPADWSSVGGVLRLESEARYGELGQNSVALFEHELANHPGTAGRE